MKKRAYKKISNNSKITTKALIASSAALPSVASAGGGGGGGGGGGDYGIGFGIGQAAAQAAVGRSAAAVSNVGSYSTSVSAYSSTGVSVSVSISVNANGSIGAYGSIGGSSTPFLLTWNGHKYVHENDFLFGKPNTVFPDKKFGLKNYSQGIGGDTYLIQNEIKADENGKIKMQIREIEPEESFIDKLEIYALDLAKGEHFVADGNLEDSYVFDSSKTKVSNQQAIYHYETKQNTYKKVSSGYLSLKRPDKNSSITMQTGDELLLRIPGEALDRNNDNFILVDSHYRDWSLGNQVPFSRLEQFMISSHALGRQTVMAMTGVAVVATGLFTGSYVFDKDLLKSLTSIPYTYADTPTTPGGPGNRNRWGFSRSLVVSVSDGLNSTYLQTLFPRYAQASQEVVRIPQAVIRNLKEEFLTVRIKATKKHKVKTAFVFSGEAKAPELKKLELIEAKRQSDSVDFSKKLQTKNSDFLQTLPGDVIDLTLQDAPSIEGSQRHYVLKSNGFYTRLSKEGYRKIGKDWINRLAAEDRKLLRSLRLT